MIGVCTVDRGSQASGGDGGLRPEQECVALCSLAVALCFAACSSGVQSWDVATLAAVAVVLTLSALLASYIPAHRAASINPVEALRAE